ncbi:tetratricopeptide repeat protein [Aquimarina rubra]|uniref:Tetratricopeptide repeat protein n=1 Tax=Aquimarina rubra TaxID=1920033 RepID=A0ABW5LGT6_9FLAO
MTPEEKYELFERKISKELSDEEEKIVSRMLEEDIALAEEFKIYKEWNSHLASNLNLEQEQSDLEQNLKNIGDSFFQKRSSKKQTKIIKIPSWGYAIAASVAIILGIYTFTKSGPVYNDFVSIPELSITERGSEDELSKKAETSFNAQNYGEAEKHISELLKKDSANSEYLFYLGITLVEQDKYERASEVFEKLQEGTSVYRYRAIWFEALNQLKQKNMEQSRELLKSLPKEAEDYIQAQKLLKKL